MPPVLAPVVANDEIPEVVGAGLAKDPNPPEFNEEVFGALALVELAVAKGLGPETVLDALSVLKGDAEELAKAAKPDDANAEFEAGFGDCECSRMELLPSPSGGRSADG